MIDIHSHILPGVDDGSASLEETEQLLRLSWRQGVTDIVATPHFYASTDTMERFLSRRTEALARICWEESAMPRIYLGAEVAYFPGISRSQEMELLQIAGSRLLLVEMPFTPWTPSIVNEVCDLQNRQGLQPVLAHVERYRGAAQLPKFMRQLLDCGVLFQCNATAFKPGLRGMWAVRLLKKGNVHFLGSDCHNLTSRPPRLAEAAQFIERKLGTHPLEELETIAASFLK